MMDWSAPASEPVEKKAVRPPRTVLVEVNTNDIRTGHSRYSCDCPIALALGREFGSNPPPRVEARSDGVWLVIGKRCLRAPQVVVDFVAAFDGLGELTGKLLPEPLPEGALSFSFEVPPVSEWEKIAGEATVAQGGAA